MTPDERRCPPSSPCLRRSPPILPTMARNKASGGSTERMLNLVALLTDSARPLTLEDISNQMIGQYPDNAEARRTMFERDKKSLRKLGVPITMKTLAGSDAGKAAYSIDRTEYQLIDFGLSAEELSALQQAAAIVQIGTSWGKQAVQWLGGEVTDEVAGATAHVDARSDALPSLWRAVSQNHPVMFDYHGKGRVVHPYGLLARNGFWYVIAFDTARSAQVTFRVDRIESPVTVDGSVTFERPEGFDLTTAYSRDAKAFTGGGDEVAIVRIDRRVAPSVVRELGHDSVVANRPDGSVDVEVACGNRIAFRTWLYAMVDRAEVVSPENIRDEVIDDLRRLAGGGS